MKPVVLRSERLVLSRPTRNDIDAITESCQDETFPRTLASLPWPYTRADAAFYVTRIVSLGWLTGRTLTWGIRESEHGPHLGSIGWRRERGDIGFWLDARSRGRGYMTEAVRTVCEWVFSSLGQERIGWEAVAGNLASARVARSAGFRFDGERPVEVAFRDGSRPMGWHGHRLRADDGSAHEGWPV
ncbi:MAG: GNAT family N-acetyltransferase [Micrococcales bacterium]|nr:GNAT family N-acetyltransferase [Micrococcales bacterium]OJX66574.1 MAG: hypothetical protein BGO94_06830 [Micrococcales bacterium 72-143]